MDRYASSRWQKWLKNIILFVEPVENGVYLQRFDSYARTLG